MGHWEDFFILTREEVIELGKEKEFERVLDDLEDEDKYKYSDTRSKWEEAFSRLKP